MFKLPNVFVWRDCFGVSSFYFVSLCGYYSELSIRSVKIYLTECGCNSYVDVVLSKGSVAIDF